MKQGADANVSDIIGIVSALTAHKVSADHDARYSRLWRDAVENYSDLPLHGNNLQEIRLVSIDGDLYQCVTTSGDIGTQWKKISDIELIAELAGTGRTIETVKATWDALLAHKQAADHDPRYYTKAEINSIVPGNTVFQEEVFTATAGQSVYNLTAAQYEPNMGRVEVYVQGIRLSKGEIAETSKTSVTIPPIEAGAEVIVKCFQCIQAMPSSPVFVGDVAPSNPVLNTLWIDTSGGD